MSYGCICVRVCWVENYRKPTKLIGFMLWICDGQYIRPNFIPYCIFSFHVSKKSYGGGSGRGRVAGLRWFGGGGRSEASDRAELGLTHLKTVTIS